MSDAYARAGVDIDAGHAAVERYRDIADGWTHPNQLGTLGGFSGLFRLPGDESRALVGSTDGVGTKILIASAVERYGGVGGDLVNHCVNDIVVVSATPLFFLDYLAVGKLDPDVAAQIVAGCQHACRAHAMALLGGETAEMPGLYAPGHFDLAGTIVGIVDVAQVPGGDRVVAGDAIVGLPSVGLHTNGYTLARALISSDEFLAPFAGATFADALLAPHPSYYVAVRSIQAVADVKAMAHITGGGLLDNVPRTLPEGCKAVFEQQRWAVPAIMHELVRRGDLSAAERYRTLNMGIGFTLIVPVAQAERAVGAAPGAKVVGWIEQRRGDDPAVIIHPAAVSGLAVNLAVRFADGRYDDETLPKALRAAESRGYQLVHAERAGDRLSAWIDWQFAPSWWSSEARAGKVWYALDAAGEVAGFAAFDVRGFAFPWLRRYAGRADIGIFGPFGVAPAYRGTGLGTLLLDAALASMRTDGYARALIPAVGFEPLVAMYRERTGAAVADTFDYESGRRYRTTILASGSGTNAQNVLDRSADGRLPLDVTTLIANAPAAGALERARRAGVKAHTVIWDRTRESRPAYDERVLGAVDASAPELVLLLGWMHRLPPAFIDRFPEILNVHPAFLPFDPAADQVVVPDGSVIPAFRGAHAVRDALAAGASWLGASVHRVTALVDRGTILVRTPLHCDGPRDRATVTERLRPIEHAAVATAIRRWSFERSF